MVGVILNLSLWFALHVFFDSVENQRIGVFSFWAPVWGSINWLVVALTGFCAWLAFGLHWGIGRILLVAALLGFLLQRFVF